MKITKTRQSKNRSQKSIKNPVINKTTKRSSRSYQNRNMSSSGDHNDISINMSTIKLGFIGFGFMAQNLCRGFLNKKVLKPEQITCYDVNTELLDKSLNESFPGIHKSNCNDDLVQWSDVIIIAVKPNIALKMLVDIKSKVDVKKHLFISICAGITIRQIEDCLPERTRVIRSMPNSPVAVGYGATVVCKGHSAKDCDPLIACKLFDSVGLCLTLPEKDLNTVTAISGSGPAYVFMGIEAAGDGGCMMGLPRDVAQKLAAWTLMGAAKMYLESGQHPGALKDSVCSPGGTTLAGLRALESGGMRGLVMDAIEKAHDRAVQLEESARRSSQANS